MSIKEDNAELNKLMEAQAGGTEASGKGATKGGDAPAAIDADKVAKLEGAFKQWTNSGTSWIPVGDTKVELPPGVYDIGILNDGRPMFTKLSVNNTTLIRFPQTNIDKVLMEIKRFWSREEKFKEYGLIHKRGIMMWGPPGGGKSCAIKLLINDIIERGGVAFNFTVPSHFINGIRGFRQIHQDRPVVVLMEDIDAIIGQYNESEVLNILDGVEGVNRMVFLATTNYPERLGPRILNRPSRFDKRFKIGHPNAESRKIYFEHLFGSAEKAEEQDYDLNQWVKDTKGFSIAHLKELFIATVILGDTYEESLETLDSMREKIKDDNDEETKEMGFHTAAKPERLSHNYNGAGSNPS